MTKANTLVIAKVVAVFAAATLALSAFALSAQAQSVTFTRDLTIGSTGADVSALQNWLISKGYSIPAGATGYFGTQTQAAVAKFQMDNKISPTAGYFGPITRQAVMSAGGGTGGDDDDDDDDNDSGDLEGGEADLSDFELNDEDSDGSEGESGVEIAKAEFEVEGGDVRVERLEVDFQAEDTGTPSVRPWDYFENLLLMVDGEEVASMAADSRDDWDEDDDDDEHDASSADYYRMTFTDLEEIFRDGDTAEITVGADIAGNIDSDDLTQEFTVNILDEGIRAVDAEGIDQYIGDDTETVEGFGFDEEESGDLSLESNSDDPDVTTLVADDDDEVEVDDAVFVFDIENNDSADVLITEMTFSVATSSGDAIGDVLDEVRVVGGGDEVTCDVEANGDVVCEDMDAEVAGDETEAFEVFVTLAENAPEATIDFTLDAADVEAEGVDSGDESDVSGSVSSETHVVSQSGIQLSEGETDADTNEAQTIGTFTISFNVEALEEDIYIYNGAGQSDNDSSPFTGIAASTTGVAYVIYQGGSASTTDFATDSAQLQSGADTSGSFYVVESGETEEFTLTVTLDPVTGASTALYYVELDAIRFDDAGGGTGDDTLFTVPNDSEYETNAVSLTA